MLRRWWWSLLIAAWAAGIAGYLVASSLPATYETSVSVLVGPVNADLDTLRAAGALAGTYAELAMSGPVLDEAMTAAGVEAPPLNVRAISDDATRFISIRVEHNDPVAGAAIANAITESLDSRSQQPTARPEGQLSVIDAAVPAESPIAPRVDLITGLASVTGLVGALLLILLVELIGDRLRDPAEVRAAGVPVLGAVLGARWRRRDRGIAPIVEAIPDSRAALSYQQLASRIQIMSQERGIRSVLVFGVDAGDHVGEVATNVALVLGRMGRDVILVDANRQEREIDRLMRIAPRRGLSSVLFEGDANLSEAAVLRSGISVIPYGIAEHHELVSLDAISTVLETLKSSHDLVLVASSSPDRDPNSLVWARGVEGVLLVVQPDHTHRRALTSAVESLKLAGSSVLGSVLYRTGGRSHEMRRPAASPQEPSAPAVAPAVERETERAPRRS